MPQSSCWCGTCELERKRREPLDEWDDDDEEGLYEDNDEKE